MWLNIVAVGLAACGLCFCVYLYSLFPDKVSRKDISTALQSSSDDVTKTLEKSFRSLEAEWIEMYDKFMRVLGRMEKTKGLDSRRATSENEQVPEPPLTQSDILRRWRNRK